MLIRLQSAMEGIKMKKNTFTESSEALMKLGFSIILGNFYHNPNTYENWIEMGYTPKYHKVLKFWQEYQLESIKIYDPINQVDWNSRNAVFILKKKSSRSTAVIKITVGSEYLDGEESSGWTATKLRGGEIIIADTEPYTNEKMLERFQIESMQLTERDVPCEEVFHQYAFSGLDQVVSKHGLHVPSFGTFAFVSR